MKLQTLPWVILFLPLAAAAIITLFTRSRREIAAGLSTGAVVVAFLLSWILVSANGLGSRYEITAQWLSVGDLNIEFGLRLDPLSWMMLLIVTGVASAIHIYSCAYMEEDIGYPRFFACLSFFTFSMLGIVLANNFAQLFIFWELVGVSSYMLIGYWFERPSAADAGKKAFLVNRLGDTGFLLGILLVWSTFGSLNFATLSAKVASSPEVWTNIATLAGVLIFCGAVGKSAQFPLHVWLPDAMEGPTPVSALIHAATMVAAGVYMLCRVFVLLNASALLVIAWIGGITALLSAVIAVQQDDIKRILAYSTLSQLGYMVMAVGLHGPTPAMFHLTTHAFFKALLFLAAGSVILKLHHEQNIWRMGGVSRHMPVTWWTFLVGTLALSGVPPLSGFYSKDAVLAQAYSTGSYGLFAIGVFVAVLTAFYMFRLFLVVFHGSPRYALASHEHHQPSTEPATVPAIHAAECSQTILWPLRLLATMSVVGGVIGIEAVYGSQFETTAHEGTPSFFEQLVYPFSHSPIAAISGLIAAVIGFAAAWRLYAGVSSDPLPARLGALSTAMRNRFYFDEIYAATVVRLHEMIACVCDWVDRWILSGFVVRGTHGTVEFTGRALRLLQTGNLQTYAFLFALGVAFILYLAFR